MTNISMGGAVRGLTVKGDSLAILEDPQLFRVQCYLNGKWKIADSAKKISVYNPSTNERIGSVPMCGKIEMQYTINSAWRAWHKWKDMSLSERGTILLAWYDEIIKNKDDLAKILSSEQGKPFAEALGEIVTGATYIPWYVEECRRVNGFVVPSPRKGIRPVVHYVSVGPVLAITPWNFPSSMIMRKAAPALAAGCSMIIKPASATPHSALALAELARRAGMPAGVFSVITGDSEILMEEAAKSSKIRKLSFTGSTQVGKKITAQCAQTMKRVSMELGGNAPFIVFNDAHLETAVKAFMIAKFRNAGQTCIAANRILVQNEIYPAFLEKIMASIKTLKVGDAFAEGEMKSDMGPLINMEAVERMEELIQEALDNGAKLELGGKIHHLGQTYFEPTVLTQVTPQMQVFQKEIFGPIVAITIFETEEEAVELANDTLYGLASYVFTQDLAKAWRVPEALEYGMCGLNDVALAMPEVPFGGVKESGMGREGSLEGLHEYMETRYILMGGVDIK